MSETTTEPVEGLSPAASEADPPSQATETTETSNEPVEGASEGTEQASETATETTETAATEVPPKQSQEERRFARLSAKLTEKNNEAEDYKQRLASAEALLRAGRDADPARQSAQDVEQRARMLVDQREFEARRAALVDAGVKELTGPKWQESTNFLAQMGAFSTPGFMETLTELSHAPKVIAHLAGDADALAALLAKPPRAMIAELGRLDARMEQPRVSTSRPVSNAPRPMAPVATRPVSREPDLETMSPRAYADYMDDQQRKRREAGRR